MQVGGSTSQRERLLRRELMKKKAVTCRALKTSVFVKFSLEFRSKVHNEPLEIALKRLAVYSQKCSSDRGESIYTTSSGMNEHFIEDQPRPQSILSGGEMLTTDSLGHIRVHTKIADQIFLRIRYF